MKLDVLHYSILKTTATFFLSKSSMTLNQALGISLISSLDNFLTVMSLLTWNGCLQDLQIWYGSISSIGFVTFCFAPQLGQG
jgi:hypothetical protein